MDRTMQITAHLFITRFDVCVRPLFVLWSFSAYDLLLKEETKTHDCMLVRSSSFDDNYDRVMRFRFFRSQQPMTDQRDPYAITSSNKLSAATWNGESCEVFFDLLCRGECIVQTVSSNASRRQDMRSNPTGTMWTTRCECNSKQMAVSRRLIHTQYAHDSVEPISKMLGHHHSQLTASPRCFAKIFKSNVNRN